jgi:hypothetical protein
MPERIGEREIVALLGVGERDHLDYKDRFYDSNPELAKDLMAIANNLVPGAAGYILLGVEEQADGTGRVVGIDPALVDDADLHRRASGYLNRTPEFGAYPVEVSNQHVGVVHLHGVGMRAYFPIRDSSPSLQKDVPRRRIGSHTAIASPDDVLRWYREDCQDNPGRNLIEAIPADAFGDVQIDIGYLTPAMDEAPVPRLEAMIRHIDLPSRAVEVRVKAETSSTWIPLGAIRDVSKDPKGGFWRIECAGYVWKNDRGLEYRSRKR